MTAVALIVLRCADLSASRIFYERLGLRFAEEKHGTGPSHHSALVGGALLELHPSGPGAGTVRLHLELSETQFLAAQRSAGAAAAGGPSFPVMEDPDGNQVALSPAVSPRASEEPSRIAQSWLEVQRNWWAYDAVTVLLRDDPEGALRVLEDMIAQAESDDLLGDIGAGPLEDFVRDHGKHFMDRLEALAAADPRWRVAFGSVWIPDEDGAFTKRLEALGCTQLRNRD